MIPELKNIRRRNKYSSLYGKGIFGRELLEN
jgi:hypothetical protein